MRTYRDSISVDVMVIRLALLMIVVTCTVFTAFLLWMAMWRGFLFVVEATGAWLPATFAGYAWSKWRRQCDAEAELERSLPIARIV